MSDIVNRLRQTTEQMACTSSVDMALWDNHSNACLEAADKIERLCEENEKLREEITLISQAKLFIKVRKFRAENEKLRLALKPFAYYASQIPEDVSNTASASGTVGDLRAAAAAIRESGE